MNEENENRISLVGKLIIRGEIVAKTGLHIGGSKSSLDIGGIDMNVIKTPKGVPYIPGSSLKGKMRSLLGKVEGSTEVKYDSKSLQQIFGIGGENTNTSETTYTRLLIRDCYLHEKKFHEDFTEQGAVMEMEYSDAKWENVIVRTKGSAEHPRQLERVPAGARFSFEMVYSILSDKNNIYVNEEDANSEENKSTNKEDKKILEVHLSKIILALKLLKDDYIGGSGSRGYGQIIFDDLKVEQKMIDEHKMNYESISFEKDPTVKMFSDNLKALNEVKENKQNNQAK
ncbi:type III-A CRISPR-associated RAMP protein Csm3 [Bernardetia sp. MNP-M8]|uniref:type III-A CRISPR-associated RAMP protein Csm3 n=1 Tax=Bernardetia sp. MNP-M8 TaxID=3127470 RepID=UPI0030D31607